VRAKTPLVLIGDTLEDLNGVSFAAWNCDPAARQAVKYLIEKGYRRIGFIGSSVSKTLGHKKRYAAYCEILQQSGLKIDKNLACFGEGKVYPRLSKEKIRQMFENRKTAPDAFFALNDFLAYPLLEILEEIGVQVPDDVAVIGMCDLPLSGKHGSRLTTIREPLQAIGKSVVEIMLDLIVRPDSEPQHRLIKGGELIIRSTA
jgi:LacI family transcriptional regulator